MVSRVIKKIMFKILSIKHNEITEYYYDRTLKKELKYSNLSFSQEGEDLILNRILEGRQSGFYVDVGAHHPYRFSNTYLFYKKGWRGINIDPMPKSMELFEKERPEDINVEVGISSEKKDLIYYMFNEPALNTFSGNEASNKAKLKNYEIILKKKVKTLPLKEVLKEYMPENKSIDFMSIDVEGLDLEVLKSNDWNKFRPEYILIEDLNKNKIEDIITKSDIYKFLTERDYIFITKTFNTLFFKSN